MNDIKYEIWLPSTMDHFNSVDHFLMASALYLMSALYFSYGVEVMWKSVRCGINGLIVFTCGGNNNNDNNHMQFIEILVIM